MPRDELRGARIAVVGAGVVGLCTALELSAAGAAVTLIDEEAAIPNASAIAAGMIAPAFEAALEEPGSGRLALYRAARDLWPEVADGTAPLHRDGALALQDPAGLDAVAEALQAEGAQFERLSGAAVQALAPRLSAQPEGGLFSPEDWRLDAAETLGILATGFARRGGRRRLGRVDAAGLQALLRGWDAVVLCAGWGAAGLAGAAPELAALTPIKGQLVRFEGAAPAGGPTVRAARLYMAPGSAGVVVGASMEAGRADLAVSGEVHRELTEQAAAMFPHLRGRSARALTGVRAATSDGLPLVGRSASGLHLATGFRRNGWLLAPLAARMVVDQLAGRDPGPWAEAMRPDRFS